MENPEYQAKFKAKYGYDLAPPKAWKEVRDTAEFFNGWDWDGDGRKEYGAARYSSALDAQLSTALVGGKTTQQALDDAAKEREMITEDLGRSVFSLFLTFSNVWDMGFGESYPAESRRGSALPVRVRFYYARANWRKNLDLTSCVAPLIRRRVHPCPI